MLNYLKKIIKYYPGQNQGMDNRALEGLQHNYSSWYIRNGFHNAKILDLKQYPIIFC